jgi:hypothetical protein
MKSISLLALLLAAACGGATPTPATATGGAAHAHHEGGGMHHPELTATMAAFHDVLRPLWHDDSEARAANACAGVSRLVETYPPLEAAPAGADPDAWDPAVAALGEALGAMGAACEAGGDPEPSFQALHERFHALIGLLPAAS